LHSPGADAITDGRRSRPASSPWREQALARITELEAMAATFAAWSTVVEAPLEAVQQHLRAATEAVTGQPARTRGLRLAASLSGADVERVMTNIRAAEVQLLRIAPDDYLVAVMPGLLAFVHECLDSDDPRSLRMDELAARAGAYPFDTVEREALASTVAAAHSVVRGEVARVRSLRSVILVCTIVMTLLAVGLAMLGSSRPDALPLCFAASDRVVCPTNSARAANVDVDRVIQAVASPWDVPTVELVGLIAAALGAAATMRGFRGTSVPYILPIALVMLKLPTGALTAVLGLLLMRAGFVPGFGNLDSSAQVIAWAAIFGYAQQLFTRLVDVQAGVVLESFGAGKNPLRRRRPAPAATPSSLSTQVDAAVKGAVPAALREALAGPVLSNFSGWLGVRIVDQDGVEVALGADRELTLTPGRPYHLRVSIGSRREREEDVALRISDGANAPAATFVVALESSDPAIVREERSLTVATAGEGKEVSFPLAIAADGADGWVWIRVIQRGRLVLQVELGLAPVRTGERR
jgi:hypothetical protein